MSQLVAIYAALALKTVTVTLSGTSGGETPKIYDLDELPQSADTAILPCRLLLPIGMPTEGKGGEFIAMGQANKVTWVIPDLLLWKPVGQGLGLSEVAPDLMAYAAAYADMLKTFRAPAAACILARWTIMPGIFIFPKGSQNQYTGVQALLEIEEVMM